MSNSQVHRNYLRRLFSAALEECDVARAVAKQVLFDGETLRVGDTRFRIESYRELVIIAAGKAAHPMSEAVLNGVQPALTSGQTLHGVIASGGLPRSSLPNLRYYAAGHPIPNESSAAAAQEALSLLRSCSPESLVFFLVSGGASAMLESPLIPDVSIADLREFYRALVHSGLPIVEMNCLRKHVSAVKGGRLAGAAIGRAQCTLVVSDVPNGFLDMVGSGPSLPDASTLEESRRILERESSRLILPPSVRALLNDSGLPETLKHDDRAFARSSVRCVASNQDMLEQAASLASADGYHVELDSSCDDWDYSRAGRYLIDRIQTLQARHGPTCLISGGEVSVRLPEQIGTGGRNQQFALWCALELEDRGANLTVLSAGSDGLDGNSPAAGAVVDRQTCSEGRSKGLDPQKSLLRYDAYSFLSEVDAVVRTGATGNNVRDLRILLSE